MEYNQARCRTSEALQNANAAGGNFFRSSCWCSVSDMAWRQVEHKTSYTQISGVYREFLARTQLPGVAILMKGWQDTSAIYVELYKRCAKEHGHISAHYEKGRIHFDQGNFEECVADITSFIQAGGRDDPSFGESLLLHGTVLNETGDYDEAIVVLSDLIEREPKNKEAYYQRAMAFFETGEYDQAQADFRLSDKLKELAGQKRISSEDFSKGLLLGLVEGHHESIHELLPSLWYSLRGIGTALWTSAQQPLKTYNNFVDACAQAIEIGVRHMQSEEQSLLVDCVEEFRTLVDMFDQLPELERGRMTGYLIGKHGTDILSGAAALKCMQTVARLRNANRLCLFEAMETSPANAEHIISGAARHQACRSQYFSNVKIHVDKQNKHVVGAHNYELGKSIFEHPDPQKLLNRFAGTGKPTRPIQPGDPGYREIVNFGEFIGYHVYEQGGLKTATSWGEIHYSRTGAHIVPVLPR